MFGKFFKKSSSKGGVLTLTPEVLNTIDLFITVINDFIGETDGLYREEGEEKAVMQLEAAAMAGGFDERKLNAACSPLNPHVLTATFKKILLAHQPLIPADLYDTVLSSRPLSGVLRDIPEGQKDALEVFLRHVWTISTHKRSHMDLSALSEHLCTAILRGPADNGKVTSAEAKAAFIELVRQRDELFRAGGARRRAQSADEPDGAERKADDAAADAAADAAGDSKDSIMNRSVKITVPKGFPPVTDDEVTAILSIFGDVHQVGLLRFFHQSSEAIIGECIIIHPCVSAYVPRSDLSPSRK